MRRYEPKPWDIRRCDMVRADDGEYVLYKEARAEIAKEMALSDRLAEALAPYKGYASPVSVDSALADHAAARALKGGAT